MDKLKQTIEMPNWAKRDFDADMAECPVSPSCLASDHSCLLVPLCVCPCMRACVCGAFVRASQRARGEIPMDLYFKYSEACIYT